MSAPVKRVLPADVYDALEFSALVEDGIGAGRKFVVSTVGRVPYCIYGHANALCGECGDALRAAGIRAIGDNDRAVADINARKRTGNRDARVSFADWCAELGVERGS